MSKKTVFIDGSAGTTGLRIRERIGAREDLELMVLPEEKRKDDAARREALNSCDIAFLCLPDEAARQAVSMVENPHTVVLDTSTAHRTDPAFAYGFPELSAAHREKIAAAKRIAVPGCHAGGFIALVYPLVAAGVLRADTRLVCHSLTGYSGGGKKMIAEYEDSARNTLLQAPRQYGLGQMHKHLPEMTVVTGISRQPAFCPVVGDFYSGMEVTVPIFREALCAGKSAQDVRAVYQERYAGRIVFYREDASESGFLSAGAYSGRDCMEISVHGSEEIVLATARYDNLGKGASGAAVECMNLALGLPLETGLVL